jgi:acetolactate synthase I/II/III large subunit
LQGYKPLAMSAAPLEAANKDASHVDRVRVLVVDDDHLHLRTLQRTWQANPRIELTVVDNAIDGLLALGSLKPDLAVLDIFMPDLDGVEACRRIKSNRELQDVEIILASAALTPELERAARHAGARGTVAKPYDLRAMIDGGPRGKSTEPPTRTTIRAADLLVRMLEEAGVEVVFGLPGGAISPIHDALIDSGIRVVTTRHESGAMFAAAAHARATGKLAVVAVTSGPGALNSMTGLATAWCDGVPVLLLVGEVPRPLHGKGVLQDGSAHGLQIVEMAKHVAKLAVEVPHANALPHLLRRAIDTALAGRPGPVVLTLPLDVTTARLQPPQTGGTTVTTGHVAPELVAEVARLLVEAKRPLILAGNGARAGQAPAQLVAIAEHLGCPVATTPKGKGVFPETHPLALGMLGLGGHRTVRAYLEAGVDVVLAIGTSLGDLATDGFSPLLQAAALVHVDVEARQLGKSYAPTHAIVGDAADFLGALARQVEGCPRVAMRVVPDGIARHVLPASSKPDRLASHDAITELQAVVPADTIFTVDSGEHFLFAAHYLELARPDQFVVMTGLGSMGPSIGGAIGAQLAHPDRFVAAICGDGCFAMNAFEVATAVAERLPIRVFVFNDQRLGMVETGHQTVYGRHPLYPTAPLDVCAVARGLGATARAVIREAAGPVVIEVQIDPDIVLPRTDRVASMAPGVSHDTARKHVN